MEDEIIETVEPEVIPETPEVKTPVVEATPEVTPEVVAQ